ncbi:hypothetical protein [Streptomyces sp. NPDC047841]|uniref:hypothetical protein n=1 Tax=Streptomyces sp. NPDC047841 TaxID=3154708 RepID=UPI0034561704
MTPYPINTVGADPAATYGRPPYGSHQLNRRTLLTINAAACCHHDGDTEQACRRTVDALTALPADCRSGLVHRRALDLFEAIPAQHHRERAVRQLQDVLAA